MYAQSPTTSGSKQTTDNMQLNPNFKPATVYNEQKVARQKLKSAIITVADEVGILAKVLLILGQHKVNMTNIASKPSSSMSGVYDIFIDFTTSADTAELQPLVLDVEKIATSLIIMGHGEVVDNSPLKVNIGVTQTEIQWFPHKASDIDLFAEHITEYGEELADDHPGVADPEYVKRRKEICQIARNYKHGQVIPRIEYTEQEIATWRVVYTGLKELFPTHACKEHRHIFPLLESNCGYSPDSIPQLEDVSRFLKSCTGWTVRPVMGLLSTRDFLNALAFRVFHSTQYIRHHSKPKYTPEPDICHELLGHVPLLADPAFARFSQEIGLASLGASEDDLKKLGTLFWWTVEFGLCKQDDGIRAYGAGLLSSFGELEYCLKEDVPKLELSPERACLAEYDYTKYQPQYFVAPSFEKAREEFVAYANSLDRTFSIRYNPYTETVDVLDTNEKLMDLAQDIRFDTSLLYQALKNNKH